MRFSERWLREWVDPPVGTEELAEQLTMAGLEVEAIEAVAPPVEGVVVARIVSAVPHPRADRLRVCEVDDGHSRSTIVCGAPNARPGILVPLARVGARLPGGVEIEEARLRGVVSAGMLCSASELGLAEEADGLLELPADLSPGTPIDEALGLADRSIEVALTPNRGDCLSIAGLAREVATINRLQAEGPVIEAVPAGHDRCLPVRIDAPEACTRYVGRVITGIDGRMTTPLWLRERLRRSGLRSIGPVVDVTNLVMLELGQPMHAFDLDHIESGVRVRRSRSGEGLTLLDGRETELLPDTLVIADEVAPLALAGIMGGQSSAVTSATGAVFLEAAHFRPEAIAGQARAYGLHTDSAHRFERGVDETLPERAIERATRLLLDIVGGEPGPVMVTTGGTDSSRPWIGLERASVGRLLGLAIDDAEIVDTLERLGMIVEATAAGWRVQPPSFRFDIGLEADLIEEVARIHGYDRLPDSRPFVSAALRPLPTPRARLAASLSRALVDRGYHEVICYSFVDPELQRRLVPDTAALPLTNPLAGDISVMRTSLWPGLVATLQRNQSRQQERIRLFEIGRRFVGPLDGRREITALGCAITGPVHPRQWGESVRHADFYDLKGDLEETLGGRRPLCFQAARHPALHPGRSARILDEAGHRIGWIGELHPEHAEALGIEGALLLCEIDLDGFDDESPVRYVPVSRFPAVQRDLAVIVDDAVPAGELLSEVREHGGRLLVDAGLFDVYRGDGVEKGMKSVAIHLTFQDISRTLTDDETDGLVASILHGLTARFGARLRG